MDQIIRQQVMSERDADEGDLEWADAMEECRRELPCVCQKISQAVGWQPRRPRRPYAPKLGEQREKAMRTSRAGRHLFTSSDEDSEENEPEGRRARPRDPWLAPVHVTVEHDLVWGGYIDSTARGKPLSEEGKRKIEVEVNDFHSERMNSPPQTSSPEYWAQTSLRYPIVAQSYPKIPLHPRKQCYIRAQLLQSGAYS